MSKKMSDEDVLARLQEMLGGRSAKEAASDPGGNGGSGNAGGSAPSDDHDDRDGATGAQESSARTDNVVAQAEAPADDDFEDASERRDAKFVAFLQQCENELNAPAGQPARAL